MEPLIPTKNYYFVRVQSFIFSDVWCFHLYPVTLLFYIESLKVPGIHFFLCELFCLCVFLFLLYTTIRNRERWSLTPEGFLTWIRFRQAEISSACMKIRQPWQLWEVLPANPSFRISSPRWKGNATKDYTTQLRILCCADKEGEIGFLRGRIFSN